MKTIATIIDETISKRRPDEAVLYIGDILAMEDAINKEGYVHKSEIESVSVNTSSLPTKDFVINKDGSYAAASTQKEGM